MTRELESSGHVSRRLSPDDRRVSIVEITDAGVAAVAPVRRLWGELAEEATFIGNLENARPANLDVPHGVEVPGKFRRREPLLDR